MKYLHHKSVRVHDSANLWGEVEIDANTNIGAFCDIGNTKIGKNCKIQCHVSLPPGTRVGNNVFIGPGARCANDNRPRTEGGFVPEGVTVEDGASIGMGALIGAGVTIGKNAMIGMGAVVTKDVPAGETWVGNPARKIKQYKQPSFGADEL